MAVAVPGVCSHDAALSSSTRHFDFTSIDDVPTRGQAAFTATMSYITRTLGNIRKIGLKVCYVRANAEGNTS